ncbi:hypothetical protein ADIARSV_3278 [Arcticibacter svalbardensis MN12-7]|uniref:Uncharacterized protein n=2 Tax=Arcticibacter TaxID=1288026 RepID=R9GPV5_9SPHI|nr:hypothetical protein ADIARSV_3278 [Arcticibacter svalbardensis MN12-7]
MIGRTAYHTGVAKWKGTFIDELDDLSDKKEDGSPDNQDHAAPNREI